MLIYKNLPDNVNIVEYEESLAGAVAEMWNQSGDSWGGDMSVRTAEEILAEYRSGAYVNVYVAERGGEALGIASLAKYYRDGNALYLHVLNVRPDWHSRKVGKALVLQCVERTVELGYPRLDIHTWPGNTKSVPLYKKCGYMWEDRVDSTHLVNFIPTVLKTEACKGFFGYADWYADSKREIQVKPDGVKLNGFEVFEYIWERDGRTLRAGFERTGRRMRLLETDDYRVCMTAESHELAFGLSYGCAFEVVNKSGNPLSITVRGKDDGNVRFRADREANVTETKKFDFFFNVGEIAEPQDIWQVHPCVLADVYINGKLAEFGMGIETKWPVELVVIDRKKIAAPGTPFKAYFNLTSSLRQGAKATVRLPDGSGSGVIRYKPPEGAAEIPALGRVSLEVMAEAVGYGHEPVKAEYEIELSDGRRLSYARVFHAVSQGLSCSFGYETETHFILHCGLWRLRFNKVGAYAGADHLLGVPGGPSFPIGQLCPKGGRYGDEFERMKPVSHKICQNGDGMALEVSYRSGEIGDLEYTSIFTVCASGVFTRRHRVTHTGKKKRVEFRLKDESHPALGHNTVLPYDGGVQTIYESLSYSAESLDHTKIDENWMFEDGREYKAGICWSSGCKPSLRWGDAVFFEHEFSLMPGESAETPPVCVVHGQFRNFGDFRDYAMQTYTAEAPETTPHVEWIVKNGNPFGDPQVVTAKFINRRNQKFSGEVTVSAGDREFVEEEGIGFTPGGGLPETPDCLSLIEMRMDMVNFEKTWTRAIWTPRMEKEVALYEGHGVYAVSNGAVTYKVDPSFSDCCYSLVRDGREWITSRYPSREPYAWFNPFIGGLNGELAGMRDSMIIREPISAAFSREKDRLGNIWRGVMSTVSVESFEDQKGMAYTQYYLTLPGVPVLCYFARLRNMTGLFKDTAFHIGISIGRPEDISCVTISGTDGSGCESRMRAGSDSWRRELDRLAAAGIDKEGEAGERMYIYRAAASHGPLVIGGDNKVADVCANERVFVENGGVYATKPLFLIFTDKNLTAKPLADLDKVAFENA